MNKIKMLMASCIMLLNAGTFSISSAAALDRNMQIIAASVAVLQSSSDKTVLMTALDSMEKAVDDSMGTLPEKISEDDEKSVDEYNSGLNALKKEIQFARESIAAGRLSDVNGAVRRMNDIKVENHKKFR
ncbi:TPA: cytochrome b562 family protein [Escherichia coli]|uniref:cytochrome b562 n=1 Tax=Enterobacteriaceae TaxID=543 RepID=UPI0002A1D579|nr:MULTISPECIES: cytochrome b562 [Enterobacteriaceae]EEZ6103655.1 cytochrome b562 family protein [Escherichia coli O21]HAN2575216.1 cytochrome b562 family protein [Escherichia coli O25b:H4-ST131]HAX0156402.1 cytochrome b562 family protein [Escherichia coli JJ2038]AKA92045.1 hypothetical protein ECVR50_3243 [Escherichia coli VR50]AQU00695.1 cytochrome b562 family protein [Escherichia coli]